MFECGMSGGNDWWCCAPVGHSGGCAPRQTTAEEYESLSVKSLAIYVPVSAQQLLDAGLPLPPGMEPPAAMPRPAWHRRIRWAYGAWKMRTRERIGFWIAGYTPDD